MSDVVTVALISGAFTILGSFLTILFVSRKQANSDARRANADVAERGANIALKAADKIDEDNDDLRLENKQLKADLAQLRIDVNQLTTALRDETHARAKMQTELDTMKEEREEWQRGIGMLLAQMGEARMKPRWKPRDYIVPEEPKSSHGFKPT